MHFVSSNSISLQDFKLITRMLGCLHKLQYEIARQFPKVRSQNYLHAVFNIYKQNQSST
jgi:hypothetical protein